MPQREDWLNGCLNTDFSPLEKHWELLNNCNLKLCLMIRIYTMQLYVFVANT